MKPYNFYKALHARGGSLKTLAAKTKIAESQLSMIFSGYRKGTHSWKHVAPHLTAAELKILNRDRSGKVISQV